MNLTGKVVKRPFAAGTKSARDTVMLEAGTAAFVLRRRGANPFVDPTLNALIDKTIHATGELHGHTFLMDSWQVDDISEPDELP
jgi:hypothetical protein